VKLAPGGHAGQAAGVVAVEGERALGEAVDVRRGHVQLDGLAVDIEEVAVEAVDRDEDDVHAVVPSCGRDRHGVDPYGRSP
jgi:hypothetical protein